MSLTLVWFRRNLRLSDNPALAAACARGAAVLPVFIWAPEEEGAGAPGAAARWWLGRSLEALDAGLRERGSRLVLLRGPSADQLGPLVRRWHVQTVVWERSADPHSVARDARVAALLRQRGVEVVESAGPVLLAPAAGVSASGRPYQVFTPFWRAARGRLAPGEGLPAPTRVRAPARWPRGARLDDLGLAGEPRWASGFQGHWQPGEMGAARALGRFVSEALLDYPAARELPAVSGTSRLSPHLHWGEISVHQVWRAVEAAAAGQAEPGCVAAAEAYQRQLGWREFAHALLDHFPQTPTRPLRTAFDGLRWRRDPRAQRAWEKGVTGYPIVDAGMRELWATGWMHNRVRMIVASFLVKDLLIDWRAGARWFWDSLVDADLANNTLGWQWAAGCGADAAPFFRIFNPVLQGARFDPDGAYVRRWVPELARLDARWIHRPWLAPTAALAQAGVVPGKTYPLPIVDHARARERALAAFAALRVGR